MGYDEIKMYFVIFLCFVLVHFADSVISFRCRVDANKSVWMFSSFEANTYLTLVS